MIQSIEQLQISLDRCDICNFEFPSNQLAPICCIYHQLCINCYCGLLADYNQTQTCYCCFRSQLYFHLMDKAPEPPQSFDESIESEIDVLCQNGDSRGTQSNPTIDHITIPSHNNINIYVFQYTYVRDNLMHWYEGLPSLDLDISLVPLHTPLHQFQVPIIINEPIVINSGQWTNKPQLALNQWQATLSVQELDKMAVQYVKSGVQSELKNYLNSFRANKIVSIDTLITLVTARMFKIQARVHESIAPFYMIQWQITQIEGALHKQLIISIQRQD